MDTESEATVRSCIEESKESSFKKPQSILKGAKVIPINLEEQNKKFSAM